MQFISGDTSVWIDFSVIGYVHAPFLLKDQFTFMMSGDSIIAERYGVRPGQEQAEISMKFRKNEKVRKMVEK